MKKTFILSVLLIAVVVMATVDQVFDGIDAAHKEHAERVVAVEYKAPPVTVRTTSTTTTTTAAATTTTQPREEITVVATAYCSCEKCCGKWALNRPNGIVYTASGAEARAEHTIAVDPDVFPYGTVLEIGGIEYVAEDTGSAIVGNRIDIYFDDHQTALEFGRQELTAFVKD